MTFTSWFVSKIGRIVRFALLLALFAAPMLATKAQDDDRPGAPHKLSVESRDTGNLLSWEAPVKVEGEITNYVISGSHVRRGVGIVERVSGATGGQSTSWLDRQATDPDLLYVYRVRALFDGVPGRWSGFVITGFERVPLQSTPAVEFEPTAVVPEPAVEPTAVLPPPEPTAAGPEPEPTAAPPSGGEGQGEEEPPAPTAVPPPAEPTAAPPVVEVQPTAVPPPPEPTAAGPEPEPTSAPPPADQQQQDEDDSGNEGQQGQAAEPTAVPPPAEPTAAPPVVKIEPTAAPPQPEPTAARSEPRATAAPPPVSEEPTGQPEGGNAGT